MTNPSEALFANTLILSGLHAVAAGSCGFMRINNNNKKHIHDHARQGYRKLHVNVLRDNWRGLSRPLLLKLKGAAS